MKLSEVLDGVNRVREMAGDDEAAHSEEDDLRRKVLEAIAALNCEDCEPWELAMAALATEHFNFTRWCA